MSRISQDKDERKAAPMARGLLDYFPAALAGVAACSLKANEQHNPGEEMHWARDKSDDHADCILRHMIDRDEVDDDGIPHVDKIAWRALAMAQEWHEKRGATPGRASRFASQEERSEAVSEDIYAGVQEHEKSAAQYLDDEERFKFGPGDVVRLVYLDDEYPEEREYLGIEGVVQDHSYAPDVLFYDGYEMALMESQLELVRRGS